ncbi:MAG: tRNA (N(6)-L-threonylcarbamoyladenosine(37)-C(2))-methylthiotransferase MtaB [Candidatus Omnitrophota bacterium]
MKVKFITLGCKVNQYETQALEEEFESCGCQLTDGIADLYVINTCTVTSRADRKSREAVMRVKRQNPQARIAVCGCYAIEGEGLRTRLGVDYVITPQKKQYIADIVLNHSLREKDIWSLKIHKFFNQRAFVKIQDGCDNCCSFCKVPLARGPSCSRPRDYILDEIKQLSLRYKEIVLCGINLGLYGKDLSSRDTLPSLIDAITRIAPHTRIRLSSFEPAHLTQEIINIFSYPNMCPHLHLPFQSGDDAVLKGMNKKERVSFYEKIVSQLRAVDPFFAISCDIMVGFPCETDALFQNTVAFLRRIRPMRMHVFTFSPREGTTYSGMKIKNHAVVRRRNEYVRKMASEFGKEYRQKFLGRTLSVIAEERRDGYNRGYSENYLNVNFRGKTILGELYKVKIKTISRDALIGSAVAQ